MVGGKLISSISNFCSNLMGKNCYIIKDICVSRKCKPRVKKTIKQRSEISCVKERCLFVLVVADEKRMILQNFFPLQKVVMTSPPFVAAVVALQLHLRPIDRYLCAVIS